MLETTEKIIYSINTEYPDVTVTVTTNEDTLYVICRDTEDSAIGVRWTFDIETPVEEIISDVLKSMDYHMSNKPDEGTVRNLLMDKDYVMSNIQVAVRNKAKVKVDLSRDISGDIAAIMFVDTEEGNALVSKQWLKDLGIDADTAWQNAAANTYGMLIYQNFIGMRVITTANQRNGAGVLAVPLCRAAMLKHYEVDALYIIPSSTQELIAMMPEEVEGREAEVVAMISDVNADKSIMSEDEILSNKLYKITKETIEVYE